MKNIRSLFRAALAAAGLIFAASGGAVAGEAKSYPDLTPYGFAQFTGTFGSAATPHQFGFDRVELGLKGDIDEKIGFRVLIELLKLDKPVKANTTVEGLLDAAIIYRPMPAVTLSAGQYKTPFGMEINTSSMKLDVINVGMSGNVATDRGVGLMASGRNLADSGLGYDLGIFNAGTRGDGTSFTAGTLGQSDMVIGRLLFDGLDKALHLEAGGAHESVKGGSPYSAGYTALRLRVAPLEAKAEYLQGKQGARKTTVLYGQLLATVMEHFELVGKWERTHLTDAGVNLTATNTIIGINAALDPQKPQQARLQVNYVIAGQDAKMLGTLVGFKKGYPDNQVKVLLQAAF